MFGTDYNYATRELSKAVKQLQENGDLKFPRSFAPLAARTHSSYSPGLVHSRCDAALYRSRKYTLYPNPAPSSDPTTTSLTKCIPKMTRETAMLRDNASSGACSSG